MSPVLSHLNNRMKQTTIGLLFPRSSVYPGIGYDVVEGFKAAVEYYGSDANVITESAGIGGVDEDVYKVAERLLMQGGADILVAYIDHLAAEKIEPLCSAANKILVVIEPGAVIPTNWSASPLRFHLTLDSALGSRIVADIAGKDSAGKALFATSFYDGGYLNCSAMVDAYTATGGVVCYNYIAPFNHEEFDIRYIVNGIEETQADTVLAQLSIETGKLFMEEYGKTGLSNKVKFYSSPFFLEESFLNTVPFANTNIKGVVPWSKNLENETNAAFIKSMDDRGRDANCFSALAWDAAQFVLKALEELKENKFNGRKAAENLKGVEIQSTRGVLKHDADTNYFPGPFYSAEIVKGEDGFSKLAIGEEVADWREHWNTHKSKPTTDTFSRWVNTYLCTT